MTGATGPSHTPSLRRTSFLRRTSTAVVLVWFAVPLVPLVLWSVAQRWSYPGPLPQQLGLRGWSTMTTSETLTAVAGSAVLGLLVAVGATVVGGLAGRALGGDRVPRRALVAVVLLSPVALPPFAVAMGLSPLVLRLGVPDVVATVVVLTVFAVPYTTYVFAAAHAGLDPQSEDQARMLGATRRQAVFRVTVPALRPAIAAAAFLAFLVGWGDYVVTLLIGGGQFVTLPLLVASAASGSGNEPHLAALSIVSLLPPLTTLLISSRLGSRGDRAVSPS